MPKASMEIKEKKHFNERQNVNVIHSTVCTNHQEAEQVSAPGG